MVDSETQTKEADDGLNIVYMMYIMYMVRITEAPEDVLHAIQHHKSDKSDSEKTMEVVKSQGWS